MKTIKPTKLGLLCRVFERDREPHFVVTILAGFHLSSPRSFLVEPNIWRLVADELGPSAIFDECMPKIRGEVLVAGRAFAPGGVPRPACAVRVKLGAVEKELYVVGDRRFTVLGATDPEPFTEMPVGWQNAFGGEGYAPNPIGKGVRPLRGEGGDVHPLPNIEDPKHLIKGPGDRPAPAGLGAYDPTWPQRSSKVGTYDEAWIKERSPELAADMDWGYFNVAPPDQQVDGYFQGDEAFVIENMHPDKPLLEGALPAVAARCFLTQKTPEGEVFREVVMRLDTVHLFPTKERGVLVFRGIMKIREDDAADVAHILAGCEAKSEPRPVSHYQAVLAQRLDKKKAHIYAMRDQDLMPPPPDVPGGALAEDKPGDTAALTRSENLLQKNLRQKLARQLEEAREELRRRGIDPEGRVPDLPPEPEALSLDDLPDHVERIMDEAERAKAQMDAQRAETLAAARAACAKNGLDYDAIAEGARKRAGGPPAFSAKKEMERLRDTAQMARNGGVAWPDLEAKLADPNLQGQLLKVEEKLLLSYRKLAHHFPAAARLEGDAAKRLREEVIERLREGQSLAGRDLTGADLSHLDLRGADLAGALLEAAALTGADLAGANLEGAVLARADLVGANLTGAKLAGVNLGAARLCDAKAPGGVDLTGAVLAEADLSGADLRGALLSNADLSEAIVPGADLRGVTATQLIVMKCDLSGAELSGANLQKCLFFEVNVEDADLRGANLSASVFVMGKGDRARLEGATLDNLRLVKGSSFAGASFRGASLRAANLRGARLAESDLTEANLSSAELSEADLTGARLDFAAMAGARLVRTDLSRASLVGADLMEGMLQKAKLYGAVFENANLFRADASKARGDTETSFQGANVKRVLFTPSGGTDGQR